uniref:Uncharacterized protein n=1 Tax=Sphaerodactylus townsendi TaxID=933632 RepID=A0ACB8G5L9_9SAUR
MCSGLSASPSACMSLDLPAMPCTFSACGDQRRDADWGFPATRPVEGPLENSLLMVSDNDMSSAISSILKDLDFMEAITGHAHLFGCRPREAVESRSCETPGVRPSPVAPAEEILKTFPSCNSSSASNIPMCRSDLSDLDHIMEILVGS